MNNDLKRTAGEIEDLIIKVGRIMNKRLRDSLRNSPITPPQFYALVKIYRESGMTIGDLCDRMFLACSTVSGLVDRLEKANLVERYRDDDDRRVVRLKLTPNGFKHTEEILENRREKFERDLEMIRIERREELIEDLNQLVTIMNNTEELVEKKN